MKVLVFYPLSIPLLSDINNEIEELYSIINCDLIEHVYPFKDNVVLICDDCGMISGKQIPNRKVGSNIIFGPFILCGYKDEDYCSLNEDQINKYKELLYYPEVFRLDVNDEIKVKKIVRNKKYDIN